MTQLGTKPPDFSGLLDAVQSPSKPPDFSSLLAATSEQSKAPSFDSLLDVLKSDPADFGPPPKSNIPQAEWDDKVANVVKGITRGTLTVGSGGLKGIGVFRTQAINFLTEKIASFLSGQNIKDPERRQVIDDAIFRFGNDVDSKIREKFKSDPRLAGSFFFNKVPEAIGSTLGFVGIGIATGGAGTISRVASLATKIRRGAGVVTAASLLETSSIFDQIKARGGTDQDAAIQSIKNGLKGGALELIPISRLFKILDRSSAGTFTGTIKRLLKDGVVQGFEESIQELAQEASAQEAIAEIVGTDPDLVNQLQEAAEVGGVSGFIMGVLFSIIGGRRGRTRFNPDTGRQEPAPAPQPGLTVEAQPAADRPVTDATGPPAIPLASKEDRLAFQKQQLQTLELAEVNAIATSRPKKRTSGKARGTISPDAPFASINKALENQGAGKVTRSEKNDLVREAKTIVQQPPATKQTVKRITKKSQVDILAKVFDDDPERIDGTPPDAVDDPDATVEQPRRPGYTFLPAFKSQAQEVRNLLPDNLKKNVKTIKSGSRRTGSEDGQDVMGDIGAQAMADAIITFGGTEAQSQEAKAKRAKEFILENTEGVTSEERIAAQNLDLLEKVGREGIDTINVSDLKVGDTVEIDDVEHVVKSKGQGVLTLENGVELFLPQEGELAIDKGTLEEGTTELTTADLRTQLTEQGQKGLQGLSRKRLESKLAAIEARAELGGAIDDLARFLGGRLGANQIVDPEVIKRVAKIVTTAVNAGVKSFADIVNAIADKFSSAAVRKLEPIIRAEYERLRATNPSLEEAGNLNEILGKRKPTPPKAKAPKKPKVAAEPVDTVTPEGNVPPTDAQKRDLAAMPLPPERAAGEIFDRFHADRDEAVREADNDAENHRKEIRRIVGTRLHGAKAQAMDRAIHLYIDLKGRFDEQIGRWATNLTDAQIDILNDAQKLPDAAVALANTIIKENQVAGRTAENAGILKATIENYTARIWRRPTRAQDKAGAKEANLSLKQFRLKTDRAKRRTLESILHGWSLGKELRIQGATIAQNMTRSELAQTRFTQRLVDEAQELGVMSTKREQGFVQSTIPGLRKWEWIGSAENAKIYSRNVFFSVTRMLPTETVEGDLWQEVPLYVEKDMARRLNAVFGRSVLFDIPGVTAFTKFNSIFKHLVLFYSFFHHQAFGRSSILGSRSINIIKSYREGQKAIEGFTPELRELVRAGMTLGEVRDWDEMLLKERTRIGEKIDRIPMAKQIRAYLFDLRDRSTDFLFKRLGANLKAQTALLDYAHLLQKHHKRLEAGTLTRHELAKEAANIANNDFGGLHLGRLQRNPSIQHAMQLLLLAPDWTESNIRSMVDTLSPQIGAVKKLLGREEADFDRNIRAEVARAFWFRIIAKVTIANVLFNYVMAALDDAEKDDKDLTTSKKFVRNYQAAWKEGRLRWLDVDITPIYRALGGRTQKRKWFSLIGHFRDPIKFLVDPRKSGKHKSSIAAKIAFEFESGTDWAGRSFTTWRELLGIDDKGLYKVSRKGKFEAGDPKGGKLKGQLVKFNLGQANLSYPEYLSFLIHTGRGLLPIAGQQAWGWYAGEMDGFDAITKSLGLYTATDYPKPPLEGEELEARIDLLNARIEKLSEFRRVETRPIEVRRAGIAAARAELLTLARTSKPRP